VLGGERDHPAGALCEIDAPGVEVALISATERGFVVHLQSYADGDVEVHVAGKRLTIRAGDYVAVSVGRA